MLLESEPKLAASNRSMEEVDPTMGNAMGDERAPVSPEEIPKLRRSA